jgi:hypothetical protein
MPARIRKLIVQVDETRLEMGRPVEPPARKALALAVIENPCAGRYVENLDELVAIGEELGGLLGDRCVKALGISPGQAQSYGKAAIVGEAGELEHGALWHAPGGYAMRAVLGDTRAIVPSAKKVAGVGASLDVPLGHVEAAYVRSHFDAMEVRVPDAPRAGEIVFVLAMSVGPRVHARMGGLAAADIAGHDGLR